MTFRAFTGAIFLLLGAAVMPAVASDLDLELPVSPELRQALDQWLADDDAAALPTLSHLALKGDRAARLFLGLVERTRLGPTDYVAGLSRRELLDLFRAPTNSGNFSLSWIDSLAREKDSLAVALRDVVKPEPNRDLVSSLLKAGEGPAAMNGIRYLSLYGTEADRTVLLDGTYPLHGMRAFVMGQHLSGQDQTQGLEVLREMTRYGRDLPIANDDQDAADLATYLVYGYPYGANKADNRWRTEIASWLAMAEPARPIKTFCTTNCPGELAECGTAVLGLIGGYYVAIRLASPLAAVISNETYAESPRAAGTILRRLARLESEKGGEPLASVEEIAEQSRCVSSLVAAQRIAKTQN